MERIRQLRVAPFWSIDCSDPDLAEIYRGFMLDCWARGLADASVRSYATALLRWARFLNGIATPWDRVTSFEIRDFVLALKGGDRSLAARTINHNLSVLSSLYDYASVSASRLLLNPVPRDGRAYQPGRLNEGPYRRSFARSTYRQREPRLAPRASPDHEFRRLFERLPSNRDRALVEFWVSSGARPSELLGMRVRDVDAGQQRITVIRKGTRSPQSVPASSEAFLMFALYQSHIDPDLRSPNQSAWWTLRRPARALNYEAARAMMRRLNVALGTTWTLHDFRHTAAVRMAGDPQVTITDIQRILGHASLATTQEYLRTYDADVFERIRDHLARRSDPKPPPPADSITYRNADLDELTGDSGW